MESVCFRMWTMGSQKAIKLEYLADDEDKEGGCSLTDEEDSNSLLQSEHRNSPD